MRLKTIVAGIFSALLAACSGNRVSCPSGNAFIIEDSTVRENGYCGRAVDEYTIVSNYPSKDSTLLQWKKKNDISEYGRYTGATLAETAFYNMAVDEMINNIEEDGTFRTGALWGGVWTRDVSYSTMLALAGMRPDIARNSLERKISARGTIIQDTGTGGSWPCSSDRICWAAAAWEIYLATHDKQWIRQIYPVIAKTLKEDLHVLRDAGTGLIRGESSFIDWREQSYPEWAQPADIFESCCLGTNAIYVRAYDCAAEMADIAGCPEDAGFFGRKSEELKDRMNKWFWMEEKGYYAQFLYGRYHKMLSPRSETLGEAFSILFDIADIDRAVRMTESVPVTPYGPSIFWPQIRETFDYHNNAIWPYVSAFWALACKKAGNAAAFENAAAGIMRSALLFATNQENMTASTGDYKTTALNSHNMLWSLSGAIAIIRKGLMGMTWEESGIAFSPFIPESMAGIRKLEGFKYFDGIFDITVEGCGSVISEFRLDGTICDKAFIPDSLSGMHTVYIRMAGNGIGGSVNIAEHTVSPFTPKPETDGDRLVWANNAAKYRIFRNGNLVAETADTVWTADSDGEWQVVASDNYGTESFASEPFRRFGKEIIVRVPGSPVLLEKDSAVLNMEVDIPDDGLYAVEFLYSNPFGEVSHDNKCASRTVSANGRNYVFVFPQRGLDNMDSGWSNSEKITFSKGKQTLAVSFKDYNNNMNISTNSVYLHAVRITGNLSH